MLRRADVSVSILIRKWALGLLTFCRTDAGHRWQRWLPLKSCIVHSLRVSSHVHRRNVRTRVKFVNWDVRYSRCSIGEQQQLLFACESKFVGGFEALIAWAFLFVCLIRLVELSSHLEGLCSLLCFTRMSHSCERESVYDFLETHKAAFLLGQKMDLLKLVDGSYPWNKLLFSWWVS